MTAYITCPSCGHVLANHERGIGDADIVAVLNERDRLRAALAKYGAHPRSCGGLYRDHPYAECGCNAGGFHSGSCGLAPENRARCTCGLDAALGRRP